MYTYVLSMQNYIHLSSILGFRLEQEAEDNSGLFWSTVLFNVLVKL